MMHVTRPIRPRSLAVAVTCVTLFLILFMARRNFCIIDTGMEVTEALSPNEHSAKFQDKLKQLQSPDSIVLLALVDGGFTDMAINLYETSIKPFGINNYLFVGASRKACVELGRRQIQCHTYIEDPSGDEPSSYGSLDFIRKMNIRTDMILDALSIGITVVHTDLDVVFLKNPLPDLKTRQGDLIAMWDSVTFNAGFLIVRPTIGGIWIYKKLKQITKSSQGTDDQSALNRAVDLGGVCGIHCVAKPLPTDMYMCGVEYFERGGRMFVGQNPCSNCVVVHNNWIVSKEAKVYRFKENRMWWIDRDGYYSSDNNRYLVYNNPLVNTPTDDRNQLQYEIDALQNALFVGFILDRIVVLPRFHCSGDYHIPCPLNSFQNISAFDAVFGSRYRENSFLGHPLVPDSIKSSLSTKFGIVSKTISVRNEVTMGQASTKTLYPSSDKGATPGEVNQWFGDVKEHVLVFEHLFGSFQGIDGEDSVFTNQLKQAFHVADYRQINNHLNFL